ncbi:WD40-repeat-containing domain protein [Syncephalis plumigaleata]|nr:WD40-repeat-containing domain protein [Syncephalis plumigaleata]
MEPTCLLRGHKKPVLSIAVQQSKVANASLIATGSGCNCRLWDIRTGKACTGIRAFDSEVNSVCFSPVDAHTLYAASSNKVYTFDLRNAGMIITKSTNCYEFSKDEINQIAIDEKGRFIATADDQGDVYVIELQSQRLYKRMRSIHKNICMGVTFRAKAPYEVISAGLDQQVIVWDIARGNPTAQFNMTLKQKTEDNSSANQLVNPPLAHTVATSKNGRLLAAGIGTGIYSCNCRGHRSAVACIEFAKYAPDLLVSGGNDGQLMLWSTNQVEANVQESVSIPSSITTWECGTFKKINWLTTGDGSRQENVFVSGVSHTSEDQGVVAAYSLV